MERKNKLKDSAKSGISIKNSPKNSKTGSKSVVDKEEKTAKTSKHGSIKSSRGSNDSRKGKTMVSEETFMDISQDILLDILKAKLDRISTGMVVESLNSEIIRNPFLALNILLKALGNVRYIQFVLYFYTCDDYGAYYETLQQLKRKREDEEQKLFLQKIIELDVDQCSDLSLEQIELFREHVITERRNDTLRKREALRYIYCF